MKGKTVPMRMSKTTLKIVNMIAAKMQLETGRNVSADAALFRFLASHYDELPEEAQRVIDEERARMEDDESEEEE
jgi:hypothetical protein